MVSYRRGTVAAVAALSLAVTGPAALAAQAAAAPAPAPIQRGLLDPILPILTGLTGTLQSLLGPSTLASLTSLTSDLGGDGAATSASLAPVNSLLTGLGLADIAALTQASGSGQIATPFLEPVATLLGALANLNGLTGDQASALNALKSALDSIVAGGLPTDPVAGLPLANLPLDSTQLLALGDLLELLQGGTASSPALLTPVADLLATVGLTDALPAPFADILGSLSGQLRSASSLDAGLLGQVGQLLNAIAATPGVPSGAGGLLGSLAGLLGSTGKPPTTNPPTTNPPTTTPPATNPPAGTPGGTTAAKVPAKLKSMRFDRKRGSLVLTLSCPSGKGACGSILYALSGTRSVVKPRMVLLKDGQVVERRLKLDAKSLKTLKRKAVRVTMYAITSKTQVASKGLKIAKAKPAKKKKRR